MRIRVTVPGEAPENAVLVHESAIGTDLGGKFVLEVNDKNIVEQRPVELGRLPDAGMRVIEKGLGAQEKYIVNGLQRARPGLPVNPQMEETPEPESQPAAAAAGTSQPAQVPTRE